MNSDLQMYQMILLVIVVVLGLILTLIGDILVIIGINQRKKRTPTVEVLTQILISDICLALFLFPAAITSAIKQKWVFGPGFCLVQVMAIHVFSTMSYLLRLFLAIERLLFAVKRHGTKISLRKGRLISFTCFCITVISSIPQQDKGDKFEYVDGFYSCAFVGNGTRIITDATICLVFCAVIIGISIRSSTKTQNIKYLLSPTAETPVLQKIKLNLGAREKSFGAKNCDDFNPSYEGDANSARSETKNITGTGREKSLGPEERNTATQRTTMHHGTEEVIEPTQFIDKEVITGDSSSHTSFAAGKSRRRRAWHSGQIPITKRSLSPDSESMYALSYCRMKETRTTKLLALLNISMTLIIVLRLNFIVITHLIPNSIHFYMVILLTYIMSCAIQPYILFCCSSKLRSIIVKVLKKPSASRAAVFYTRVQPLVFLLPRDETAAELPTFLEKSGDVKIHARRSQADKESDRQSKISRCKATKISVISIQIETEHFGRRSFDGMNGSKSPKAESSDSQVVCVGSIDEIRRLSSMNNSILYDGALSEMISSSPPNTNGYTDDKSNTPKHTSAFLAFPCKRNSFPTMNTKYGTALYRSISRANDFVGFP